MIKQLHDRDFNLWVEQMAIAIKNRDIDNMDWDNLLEEIEDMGASQKRALDSYMQRLIEHIFKLKYWYSEKEYNQKHWEKEVVNFRSSIKRILKKNPSLKNYVAEEYEDIYQDAIAAISREFPIPDHNFLSLETIMKDDFFGHK